MEEEAEEPPEEKSSKLSTMSLKGKLGGVIGDLTEQKTLDSSAPFASLKGKLGGAIGDLTELKSLDLSNNYHLTGPLPPQLGNLSNLIELSLDFCTFTGSIPDELGNLTRLSKLNLGGNKLIGKIPPRLGKLTKINLLDLSQNQLSGKLPLLKAEMMWINHNKLSGTIPSKLFSSNMALKYLWLNQNALSGKISSTIRNLTNLIDLNLSQNRLSGSLPDLSKMASLKRLQLSNNSFDAAKAPTWFSTMPSLISLEMEYGSLQGPVPTKLFSLPMIQIVNLKNNAFNGTLAISGSSITKRHFGVVDLQNNQISSVTFDSNSTTILMLSGNPICAKALPTSYCPPHQEHI